MTMGDRIVVMNAGRIEQVAEPEIIYHDPASIFVADFIGSPSINFFLSEFDDGEISADPFDYELPTELATALADGLSGDQTVLGIRPEHMFTTEAGAGLFDVEIEVIEPLGNTQIVYFEIDGQRYNLVEDIEKNLEKGQTVGIDFEWPHAHFFKPEGEKVAKWMNVVTEAATLDLREDSEVSSTATESVRQGGD